MAHRFTHLKMGMFMKRGDYPTLRGKAADIRIFGAALEYAFAVFDNNSPVHRWVRRALRLNNRFEELLNENPDEYKLSEVQCAELTSCARTFGLYVSALRRHFAATAGAPLLFKVTSKLHLDIHAAMLSNYLNPRLGWCYSGEAFMRTAQELVAGSMSGTATADVIGKALLRYCQGFEFEIMLEFSS